MKLNCMSLHRGNKSLFTQTLSFICLIKFNNDKLKSVLVKISLAWRNRNEIRNRITKIIFNSEDGSWRD